jgi:4-aminobutyrate aminotransferase-like enzyme
MSDHLFATHPQTVPTVLTKNRRIQTEIPAPGTQAILDRLGRLESQSMHGQLPIVWDRAENFNVFDHANNCWIDFTSTIFVANVGHSNPRIVAALKAALEKPLLSCYAYANDIRAQYLEKLLAFAGHPFEKAFLLSAGTEATEAAFKLMRMSGQKKSKRRKGVICIEGNWHGRTLAAQMMSSNLTQREWIGYQDPDIHHIPFPYPWVLDGLTPEQFLDASLEKLAESGVDIAHDICGFMLETFQGWGAVFYPPEYVKAIESICRANGVMLTFDEMQAGFGRTGRAFGFQHYGVTPDLICCGKGMGGGMALSGVLGQAEIMDLPSVGNMSSTHSANPFACAAGLAVLDEIAAADLISESDRKGKILKQALNELHRKKDSRISSILGEGLIAAVLFRNPKTGAPDGPFATKVAELCMQKGLLVVHTGRESIKIGPPLTITDDALLEGIYVLAEAIEEVGCSD